MRRWNISRIGTSAAAVVCTGILACAPPAHAAGETIVQVDAYGAWIGATISTHVTAKCPSTAPYVTQAGVVTKQTGGPRVGSVEYASIPKASIANYPSPVTVDYKNTSSFKDKPDVYVSEELHLTCSNIKPETTPDKFSQMTTLDVPPGSTRVATLTCPGTGTPYDPWATYPGNLQSTEITKSGNRAAIAFWNDSDSTGVGRFGIYCDFL